ncbi:MAG: AAA family ATPase [Myxococcaceae bacterium]|nr:AAA family ATPase [Myxococcaceae bacterium]
MLKRLYAHNFRSFVNFEWVPPRASVLVGENGAGKSAFVEVLWLLQDLLVHGRTVDETPSTSARTEWLQDELQSFELEAIVASDAFHYRLDIRLETGRTAVREELKANGAVLYRADGGKVELFGDDPPSAVARTTIPFDRRRSFISALEQRADNKRIIAFREAIGSIWAVKPDPRRLGGAAVAENPWLERDLSNFASWYRSRMGEDPDATDALRRDLQAVLAGFSTLRLEPISPEVKDLRARFSFGQRTHELGWAKLSDGQRLLIALYGLLRLGLPRASLIVLDEAENYVAPQGIQPWLQAVGDAAAEKNQQLLVVSHHPETINYLAADGTWRMWRDKDAGHIRIAPLLPDLASGVTAYDAFKFVAESRSGTGLEP